MEIRTNIQAGKESAFILAGKAILTITNSANGNHFTYKVKRIRKDSDAYYVSVAHNYDEYHYTAVLMKIKGVWELRNAKNPKILLSPSCKAFKYLVDNYINSYKPHANLIIQHEGRCGRCGRPLTDPTSISIGLGPECRSKF